MFDEEAECIQVEEELDVEVISKVRPTEGDFVGFSLGGEGFLEAFGQAF